ncbi:MAG: hypothetical protein IKE58_12215 [Blautia sp.]|nr:hypothetical protein [Blautia sp.]
MKIKLFGKYQSFSHWLSYNGKYVAYLTLGLLLILLLRFNHRSGQRQYDYKISWVGKSFLDTTEQESLRQAVLSMGRDIDGDGQITLDIVQYEVDFAKAQTSVDADVLKGAYEQMTRLLTRLQERDCYLFLTDDASSLQFTTGILRYLDGRVAGEEDNYEYANWEQMALPLSLEGLREGCWLARRSLFEKNADYEERFPGGEALFWALAG